MNSIQLSSVDERIVSALARHGRIPNRELAEIVGIPVSTCHGRVKALEERGVIRGYRADIAPEAAGMSVHAFIFVQVHGHERARVNSLGSELREIPGVQQLFLVGGDTDIIMHVAVASIAALRALMAEHLATNQAIAKTQTQVVFEHLAGFAPV